MAVAAATQELAPPRARSGIRPRRYLSYPAGWTLPVSSMAAEQRVPGYLNDGEAGNDGDADVDGDVGGDGSLDSDSPVPDELVDDGFEWSATSLHAAIDSLIRVDIDSLDRDGLRGLLVEMTGPLRRLEAARTKIAGALQRRESSGSHHPHAGDRQARDFLTGQLGLSPSEAKEVTGTARQLPTAPSTSAAYQEGQLTSRHTSVITSCLPHIPYTHRATVEAELIDLAKRLDPVALGRRAREMIARHDVGELRTVERRRRARRWFSYHHTPDGGLRFSGELFGADAETAHTAFAAFTPKPSADDRRSHDHRRADGLVTLAEAALRAGDAPTQHGVRPHVLIMIDQEQLAAHHAGSPATAQYGSGEHATVEEARYLLGDCDLTRIVLDANRTPIDVSTATRTVPAGLWRALQARDKGCTWEGCSAPAAWCDVAHLDEPYAIGGRLTPSTAALLCRRHHRTFDAGGWQAQVQGARVTYTADPGRRPVKDLIGRRRHDHARGRHGQHGRPRHPASEHSRVHPPPNSADPPHPGRPAGGLTDSNADAPRRRERAPSPGVSPGVSPPIRTPDTSSPIRTSPDPTGKPTRWLESNSEQLAIAAVTGADPPA